MGLLDLGSIQILLSFPLFSHEYKHQLGTTYHSATAVTAQFPYS
jgi:hypothetical protein